MSSQVRLFWALSTNLPILWEFETPRRLNSNPHSRSFRIWGSTPSLEPPGMTLCRFTSNNLNSECILLCLDWFHWCFTDLVLCLSVPSGFKRFKTWESSLWIKSLEIHQFMRMMCFIDACHFSSCIFFASASFVWNLSFFWCVTNFLKDASLWNYRHLETVCGRLWSAGFCSWTPPNANSDSGPTLRQNTVGGTQASKPDGWIQLFWTCSKHWAGRTSNMTCSGFDSMQVFYPLKRCRMVLQLSFWCTPHLPNAATWPPWAKGGEVRQCINFMALLDIISITDCKISHTFFLVLDHVLSYFPFGLVSN